MVSGRHTMEICVVFKEIYIGRSGVFDGYFPVVSAQLMDSRGCILLYY